MPADLAPVDEFHTRQRAATIELAARNSWEPRSRVLDVGCGLGGSARYLTSEHGCQVTGIDLTREWVDAATALTELVGLDHLVAFRRGDALDLPFDDDAFDVVWTDHAQMNIADKRTFYAEVARVLRPGGRLLFHDIFQGLGGPPHYPAFWAEDDSISFLATPEAVRQLLHEVGFSIRDWVDTSMASLEASLDALEEAARSGPTPLGPHLLLGDTGQAKFEQHHRPAGEPDRRPPSARRPGC